MADTLVTPLAEALLACLCAELANTIGGSPCQCCLRPGTAPPPADACCACGAGQGQASVQVTRIFASQDFPRAGVSGPLTECTALGRAAELTLTVFRCVACVDESGLPSCDEMADDARKILDDAQAMWRAVVCCDWRGDEQRFIPGEWRPLAPLGCCAGGTMSVTVDLGYALS